MSKNQQPLNFQLSVSLKSKPDVTEILREFKLKSGLTTQMTVSVKEELDGYLFLAKMPSIDDMIVMSDIMFRHRVLDSKAEDSK